MYSIRIKFLMVWIVYIIVPHAIPQTWISLGPEDAKIHCVFPHGAGDVLVGTDNGAQVLSQRWYKIPGLPEMPVRDLKEVHSQLLIAAVSNLTWSDAIYVGDPIINGPPYYYFEESASRLMDVHSLSTAPKGNGTDILLAAGHDIMFASMQDKSITVPQLFKTPASAFGVEDPYCTDIEFFDSTLYAGGYDRGQSSNTGALLHQITDDSLGRLRITASDKVKVTTLAKGQFYSIHNPIDTKRFHTLFIGTKDDGIWLYQPEHLLEENVNGLVSPWKNIPAPGNESIIDIVVSQTSDSIQPRLYIAVDNGVLQKCAPNEKCIWKPVGNLPLSPTCLAIDNEGMLYAGTANGIYVFDSSTANKYVTQQHSTQNVSGKILQTPFGIQFIASSLHNVKTIIRIFNALGKEVWSSGITESAITFPQLSAGVYFYIVSDKNRILESNTFIYSR